MLIGSRFRSNRHNLEEIEFDAVRQLDERIHAGRPSEEEFAAAAEWRAARGLDDATWSDAGEQVAPPTAADVPAPERVAAGLPSS